jgi:hypothetical protein
MTTPATNNTAMKISPLYRGACTCMPREVPNIASTANPTNATKNAV